VHSVHVLPICPRPYPREAARSWLTRVATVCALNAERLVGILGLVPFASHSRRFLAQPVEVALEDFNLGQLAIATQLPPVRLLEMRPDPLEWTLTDTDVCTACGLCLDEDLCYGRDPYLRAEWRQSWRIFCSIHEVRLLACPMTVFTNNASDASVIEEINELYAHCDLVQDNINRAFASNRDFFHLNSAIEEMEMVIWRAISGESPDFCTWGPLRADDFLQIVQDVTSWALTNFEAFKARPAAEELPHGIGGTGSPYFGKAPRLQPPYDSDAAVRTLSSVNEPALRCAALWWAHVLLAESHLCCNPTRLGPPSRQWNLLRSRCPVGLHWLIERMKHWPQEYVRRQWSSLDIILLPGE
jgi:TniQ